MAAGELARQSLGTLALAWWEVPEGTMGEKGVAAAWVEDFGETAAVRKEGPVAGETGDFAQPAE
jgi:hypothetical protein